MKKYLQGESGIRNQESGIGFGSQE